MGKKLHPDRSVPWVWGTLLGVLALLVFLASSGEQRVQAGGPLAVGGTFGVSGQPFTWDTSLGEVQYRTDGGKLGLMDTSTANTRVATMFQVWEDVPTASIGFERSGRILNTGAFTDGDVTTVKEFDAVDGSCAAGEQSPVIYDANGGLFNSLFGAGSGVIGFAGPCALSDSGRIVSALAALNGAFRDGSSINGELSNNEFSAVFIHEFGHFFGLDHAQINPVECLFNFFGLCDSGSDLAFRLPTMFPFLIGGLEETPGVHPARTLAADDIAWVSKLYPDITFDSNYGLIRGRVLFSDGITGVQGVNVIASRRDNPDTPEDEAGHISIMVVSGYLFSGNLGQNVTAGYLPCSPSSACPGGFAGNNSDGSPFGSRDPSLVGTFELPVPPGEYFLTVEQVYPGFVGGSSVGPLDPPITPPGPYESWNLGESDADRPEDFSLITVSAGETVSGIDLVFNGTPLRFDQFESGSLRLEEAWRWLRRAYLLLV